MGGTSTLSDLGFQPQTPQPQAPADTHPLADLGFKPVQPTTAAHPLADLGFKPATPAAAVSTTPTPPVDMTKVAGTTGVLPQPAVHPAVNMQPSFVGEVAGAAKEAATHPIETLVGADLPSQTAEKQAMLEQGAASGSKLAQSALDVQKTAQTPIVHWTDTKTFQKMADPNSKNVVSRVLTGGSKALESLSSPDNVELLATIPFAPEDAQQLLSGVFSAQMAQGAGTEGYDAIKAAHRGDYGEAAEKGATALINAAMAAASAKHAVGGHPTEAKPVLHDSNDVEELRASAERQAPKIGDAAATATEGVPGAKLEAVRDSKDTDRIADKATRQAVDPNQIADIAAAKITVPDQAAADKVLENLHQQMPVESVNGNLTESGKNGVRQVQAVVNTGAEGEPVKRAEVLIQTPEMAEATDRTHDDYRKSQELRAAGRIEEANALEEKITAEHEAAAKLSVSNQGERGEIVSSEKTEQAASTEPKFKFGSTQTNIPEDSGAHTALSAARDKVADADLAGKGKDVGGNHVTVRYGIESGDSGAIDKYLRAQPPFEAKLGDVSSFPPTKNSDGAAVLKADIDAPELHRINAEIKEHGNFKESDFPDYKPHATIAYVKPEAVDKYTGTGDTAGKTFSVRSVAITDKEGNSKEIPLEGKANEQPAGVDQRPQEETAATGRGQESPTPRAETAKAGQAPRPPAGRELRGTDSARPADVRAPKPPGAVVKDANGKDHLVPDWAAQQLRAPKPPTKPGETFKPGRQSTPVEVRDADGNWQHGTLDYYNDGVNGSPNRGRVTLASGEKMNNVADADMKLAKGAVAGITSGVGEQTKPSHGAIAYDLDKTLAHYDGYKGPTVIGKPIESEVASLKRDLAAGKDVWIFSARAADAEAVPAIKAWTKQHLGRELPVTNVKYPEFERFVDDRAEKPGYMEGKNGEQNDSGRIAEKPEQLGVGEVPAGTGTGGGDRGGDGEGSATREEVGSVPAVGGDGRSNAANDRLQGGGAGDVDRGGEGEVSTPQRQPGRGEDASANPDLARERKDNEKRLADRRSTFEAANKRSLAENAASHKSEVVEVAGRKALKLDTDGEGVWHRVFSKVKNNAVGQNPLGANMGWRGMTLSKQQVNTAIAFLMGSAEDMRVAGVPDSGGFERLAKTLKDARDEGGGAIVLRGDYRADTAREEATHQWQLEHGLYHSEAMRTVADRPEFDEIAEKVRDMGYRDASPSVVAAELMAKAMAGDTDFKITDEERDDLVRSFLTEVVEEKGPDILKNMPETDARLKGIISEVRRGYDYGDEYDQRNERGGEQEVRGSVRQAGGEVREGDRTGAYERGRQRPSGEGGERGVQKGPAPEGELKPPDKVPKKETTTGSDEPVFQRLIAEKDREGNKENPWYLKSAKILDAKMKGPMPGDALVRMLENNGVKADELKWSGLEDLKGKAKVTPEQVAEHLRENAVKVKEVTKGGKPLSEGDEKRERELREEVDAMQEPTPATEARWNELGDELEKLRQKREGGSAPAKYADYQLPGGKNYREMLMTLPSREPESGNSWTSVPGGTNQDFKSGHWDEPNILAHVRMNDRTTPDGKKLLHLEEIQSDWHQAGRNKGYATGNPTMDRIMGNTVPDAPFKKDWHEMAFRRAVKYAADNGYDGVSWTPGEKQAERYDLSKQVDRISYARDKDGTYTIRVRKDHARGHYEEMLNKRGLNPSQVAEVVGKEVAQKIADGVGHEVGAPEGSGELKGLDLKVGGEGMKGFYDKIIPDYARKFGKQWGAKVGETDIPTASDAYDYHYEDGDYVVQNRATGGGKSWAFGKPEDAAAFADEMNAKGGTKVPYLEITPEMRQDVVEQGVPLFQKAEENPVARSVSDMVDDLKKLPKADKGTALDRVANWTKDTVEDSLTRSGKALGGVPNAFEKAFAWAKATTAALIHDYTHPLEQTDWKNVMGQHQLAQSETALKLQDLAKELKAQAPKELDRIAMTHYMEAAGSEGKLKEWQAGNKARAMAAMGSDRARYLREAQKHYDKALDLSPEQKSLAKRLRQHFNDTLDIAKKNGLLEFGYRNYVMHVFEKDEAANLLHLIDTSELNPDPSFIKRRFHETLYDAEGAGLTPKSKDIGFLSTAYDKSLNEGIASRTAIKNLLDAKAADGKPIAAIKVQGGWVIEKGDDARQVLNQRPRPQNMSMEGYKAVDRPQLRNFLFKPTTADLHGIDPQFLDEDLAFRGDLMIHPKYVSRVEDMLTPSWFERGETGPQKIGQFVLKRSAEAKELMTIVAPFHLATEGRHALSHKINPFKIHSIDLSDPTERLLASHGLTLTNYDAEGLFAGKALKGIFEGVPAVNKAMDMVHRFSQWQFQEYIPGLKMAMAKEAFDRNTARYPKLSKEQVAELSAKESNAAFGNLNTTFDRIPRTKTFKSLARLAMFAPDFLESRMRFMGQAFTKYGGEQRAALIRSALITYTTMRVANALLNNGDAKWDMEHAFSLVVHGKSYSVRSVEQDALHAVTDPRSFIYNRLNPLTTRPLTEFLSGRDQYGRQIAPLHLAKETAKSVAPFGIQKVIQTPDESLFDSILTSIGIGTNNYRTPTEEAVHKIYLAHIPDAPEDAEKQAESRKMRGFEDKIRSGHMTPTELWAKVEKNEITPKEAGRTIQRAQKSRLQLEFQSLSLRDAIKVYGNANPLEQAELKPEFARKQALIAELPEADREKTAEKMQELLAENQQH